MRGILVVGLVLGTLKLFGQNNSIFNHGSSDGFYLNGAAQSHLTVSNDIYSHGAGDGHYQAFMAQQALVLNNAIFKHGQGDGQDVDNVVQNMPPGSNTIFAHGQGDGFATSLWWQHIESASNNIYDHGGGDGADIGTVTQPQQDFSNNIFVHSGGDGFFVSSYLQNEAFVNNGIYSHGDGDGADTDSFIQSGQIINNSIFSHNQGDGHHMNEFVQPVEVLNNRIFAHSASDGFDQSSYMQTEQCPVPTSLELSSLSDNDVIIAWDGMTGAVRYQVSWKLKTGPVWSYELAEGNQLSLTGLYAGSEYVVTIRSFCSEDNEARSEWSEYFHFTTTGTPDCSVPEGIGTLSISDQQTTLGWTDNTSAVKYELMYRLQAGLQWTYLSVSQNEVAVQGLHSGTDYVYRVRSYCTEDDALKSDWSSKYYFTTSGPPACHAPATPLASVVSDSEALLSWGIVDDASVYEVIYRIKVSGTWAYTVLADTSLHADGLQSGTDYEFRVRAYCTSDYDLKSDWSEYGWFTTASASVLKADVSARQVQEEGDHFGASRELLVFPNPTAGIFHVVLPLKAENTSVLTLHDFRGNLLLRRQLKGALSEALDLERRAAGVYLVSVYTSDGESFNARISKQ